MEENKNNRISEVSETLLKNLSNYIDVNTVIGAPIRTDNGDYILPVSKVTFAFITGGGEYGKVKLLKKAEDMPFSAGNGAIATISPSGFLIKNSDNNYRVLNISTNSYEKILDKANDIISNLKNEQHEN